MTSLALLGRELRSRLSPSKAGPSPRDAPRAGSDAEPLDVAAMLRHINENKLVQASSAACFAGGSAGSTPSGPRQPGQGCEDVEQAIMLAEATATGGARLRVTLLAAGFLIGPGGLCVKDIGRVSGADIRSRTVQADTRCARDCREFMVEGPNAAVARALSVMCDAVARYKELCEGRYAGRCVSRMQHVGGVDFSYQPPPRTVVPFAATLKPHPAKRQSSLAKALSTGGTGGGGSSFKEALVNNRPAGQRAPSAKAAAGGAAPAKSQPPPALTGLATAEKLSKAEVLRTFASADLPPRAPTKPQQLQRDQLQQQPLTASLQQFPLQGVQAHSVVDGTAYVMVQPGNVLVPVSMLLPGGDDAGVNAPSGATGAASAAFRLAQSAGNDAQTVAAKLATLGVRPAGSEGVQLPAPQYQTQQQQLAEQLGMLLQRQQAEAAGFGAVPAVHASPFASINLRQSSGPPADSPFAAYSGITDDGLGSPPAHDWATGRPSPESVLSRSGSELSSICEDRDLLHGGSLFRSAFDMPSLFHGPGAYSGGGGIPRYNSVPSTAGGGIGHTRGASLDCQLQAAAFGASAGGLPPRSDSHGSSLSSLARSDSALSVAAAPWLRRSGSTHFGSASWEQPAEPAAAPLVDELLGLLPADIWACE